MSYLEQCLGKRQFHLQVSEAGSLNSASQTLYNNLINAGGINLFIHGRGLKKRTSLMNVRWTRNYGEL